MQGGAEVRAEPGQRRASVDAARANVSSAGGLSAVSDWRKSSTVMLDTP